MNDYDNWDRVFDKSKASKVPEKFPGDIVNPVLQLEDVLEEVTEDINEKDHSRLENDYGETAYTEKDRQQRIFTDQEKPRKAASSAVVWNEQNGGSNEHLHFKKPMVSRTTPIVAEGVKVVEKLGFYSTEPQLDEITKAQLQERKSFADTEAGTERLDSKTESVESLRQEERDELATGLNNNDEKCQEEMEGCKDENGTSERQSERQSGHVPLDDLAAGRAITLEEARNLRFLLFGDVTTTFSEDWTRTSIRMTDRNSITYPKGPTEQLLICVQAFVFKHTLFNEKPSSEASRSKGSLAYYKDCLILAIMDILWQAGIEERATVCLPTSPVDAFSAVDLKVDGLIEKLKSYEFHKKEDLKTFLQNSLKFFEGEQQSGCVLLIYSLVMSRTIEKVNEDINGTYNCLIQQGTCSQALINLLLAGKATPNVFNNNKEVKNEIGKTQILHGISKRCQIGFLSDEEVEHPKTSTVGSMLKTPVFPIWVVSTNSRLGVLYCKKRQLLSDWKLERRFDLYYHGRKPRHLVMPNEDDVRLTIDTVRPFDPEETEYEFNSDLEDTIRTKWQDCVIEWNSFQRF